jgi:hypothetical protein
MGWRGKVGGAAAVAAPPLYGDAGTADGCPRGHVKRMAGVHAAVRPARVYRAGVGR